MLIGIVPGDCGSWVVHSETREVLGHVVAVDSFKEIYVVPLQATLQDMKESLGAASVALLTVYEYLYCGSVTGSVTGRFDGHVPKPTYEGHSGYDSGYATMQSSPATSPLRPGALGVGEIRKFI